MSHGKRFYPIPSVAQSPIVGDLSAGANENAVQNLCLKKSGDWPFFGTPRFRRRSPKERHRENSPTFYEYRGRAPFLRLAGTARGRRGKAAVSGLRAHSEERRSYEERFCRNETRRRRLDAPRWPLPRKVRMPMRTLLRGTMPRRRLPRLRRSCPVRSPTWTRVPGATRSTRRP